MPKNIYAAATSQVNQVNQALPKNENGENIADLWVKFLLNEVNSVNSQDCSANSQVIPHSMELDSFSVESHAQENLKKDEKSLKQPPEIQKTNSSITYSYPPPMFQ